VLDRELMVGTKDLVSDALLANGEVVVDFSLDNAGAEVDVVHLAASDQSDDDAGHVKGAEKAKKARLRFCGRVIVEGPKAQKEIDEGAPVGIFLERALEASFESGGEREACFRVVG